MKRKKIIALILIACISLQVLPLKEMGAMFFKAAFIEELCSNPIGSEEVKNMSDAGKWEAPCFDYAISNEISADYHSKNVVRNSIFASRFIDEPLTRPPLS